jgi:hypothetical protein
MAGQTGIPLGVEVDLTNDRMIVTSDAGQLADWTLREIDIRSKPDGFHIDAEGEKIIINVSDNVRFAEMIGLRG